MCLNEQSRQRIVVSLLTVMKVQFHYDNWTGRFHTKTKVVRVQVTSRGSVRVRVRLNDDDHYYYYYYLLISSDPVDRITLV